MAGRIRKTPHEPEQTRLTERVTETPDLRGKAPRWRE